MSMSARASNGQSGGGGIRGFFSRLRKGSSTITNDFPGSVQVGNRSLEISEIQRLIPELEASIEKKNTQLREHDATIGSQLKRITNLETEVKNLQSECDKLRSVLELKAESAVESAQQQQQQQLNSPDEASPTKALQPARAKKIAVSAEPTGAERGSLKHHEKNAGVKQLIRDAVQKNDFLRQLAKEQVIEMVECMYEHKIRAGDWVIKEGDAGDRLYVAQTGELQVSREGQMLTKMGPGRVFGELAILYNCTRTASVQALTDCHLWVLDRSAFQLITKSLGQQRHDTVMDFLRNVELFKGLGDDRLSKIADCLDQDYYDSGHYVIREGEKGDAFFIINSGTVRVTQLVEGSHEPQEIRKLGQGDFFGEKALLGEEVRTASVVACDPGCEVLTLDRESFQKLIGDLEALKKDYGDEQRRAQRLKAQQQTKKDAHGSSVPSSSTSVHTTSGGGPPTPTKVPQFDKQYDSIELKHLKTIATLGVGGFGRVELVYASPDKAKTFALKALKKKHIVDTRQQEHIFSERNIMMELDTEWICQLYKTFRDTKFVYMLLEACLGGELWTTLRDRGHFDDYTARFYVSCVLEGLEYLHKRRIVYRDLKPENCLLTHTGYLKLVDFGFAKKLASGRKTWTFCGTPEYVSPEIILNKGHDHAADYWALGIYICELMLGRPPFQASDPMKTYTLILKGVDALDVPNRRIGKTATALVKKLCRDNPGERLGCGAGGVNDIRKHRWFVGFDWEGLRTRTVKPPIQPRVLGSTDVSNFDQYPPDTDVPPDEFSGWDEGF